MTITQRQKDIAASVRKHIKNRIKWREAVLRNVRKENEYMYGKEKAQTPTRKQMDTLFLLQATARMNDGKPLVKISLDDL